MSERSNIGGEDLRIDELERRVTGLTHVISAFAIAPPAPARPPHESEMIGFAASREQRQHDAAARKGDSERAAFVRDHIRQRRMRGNFFPADYFADPVWDMLLDLYAAHYERQLVSVSSLCIASAVPATTALRWIKTLSARGLFIRTRDETDGRRIYVHLSDAVRAKLDSYFDALQR